MAISRNMVVNQVISLVVEESEDNIFIKPPRASENTVMTLSCCNNTEARCSPIHICDEENCDCILQFKNRYFNLNKIVHLNLSKCNLSAVPDSLSSMPLKSLNLSHNCLKSVPVCLFIGLGVIEDLCLSYNNIHEFETEPRCATNLRILDLKSNGMQYLPIWIIHAKCRSLLELDYSYNSLGITDENLFDKVYTYCLWKIILENACVLNKNIAFIKSIRTVKSLDISNGHCINANKNSFTSHEELFDNPAWKGNVEVLNLSSLNMGFLPEGIAYLKSLKELCLSSNTLSWLPEFIGTLEMLEVLDLSNNSLCILPNTFSKLKKLRILQLQYNGLSDVTVLQDLTQLELLDLYNNVLDSFDLDFHCYIYLDLENNCFQTSDCLSIEYVKKMENYRQKFELVQRQTGLRTYVDSDSDSSDNRPKFMELEDDDIESDVPPLESYVEECWDYKTYESHPDVTASDDEWPGYILLEKPKVKLNKGLSLEHLLDDLYADVD